MKTRISRTNPNDLEIFCKWFASSGSKLMGNLPLSEREKWGLVQEVTKMATLIEILQKESACFWTPENLENLDLDAPRLSERDTWEPWMDRSHCIQAWNPSPRPIRFGHLKGGKWEFPYLKDHLWKDGHQKPVQFYIWILKKAILRGWSWGRWRIGRFRRIHRFNNKDSHGNFKKRQKQK